MGRSRSTDRSYSSDSGSSYSSSDSSSGSSSSRTSRRERRGGAKRSESRTRRRDDRDKRRRTERSRDRRDNKRDYPSHPPRGTYCHVCKKDRHWTVDCDIVHHDPSRYSHLNLRDGCPICGKAGHRYNRCKDNKFLCQGCGDLHATRQCPFEYEPVEYHEFYDDAKGFPYYYCCKTHEISWVFGGSLALDKLLWHCDNCKILLPDKVPECVQCRGERKRRRHSTSALKRDGRGGKRDGNDGDDTKEGGSKREPVEPEGLTFAAITGWIDDTRAEIDEEMAVAMAGDHDGQGGEGSFGAAGSGGGLSALTADALRQLE